MTKFTIKLIITTHTVVVADLVKKNENETRKKIKEKIGRLKKMLTKASQTQL